MSGIGDLFLIIPQAFYWLVSNALMMVEIFQFMFRKLAGLDTYYLNGEKIEKSGDFVLQIIQKTFFSGDNNEYSVIAVTFWSIVILASILLFATTIAAIIKIEYSPGKTNPGEPKSKGTSKGKIIGNMMKAIISFVLVPLACYFGLFFGNAVLLAVDSATNVSNTSLISVDSNIENKLVKENDTYIYNIFFGQIAPANATPLAGLANRIGLYTANRVRNDKNFYETVILYEESAEGSTTNFEIFNEPDNQSECADLIDTMFMMNAKLKTPQTLDGSKAPSSSFAWGTPTSQIEYFNRYDIGLVNYYYDLWKYNFIIAIFLVWILAKTMITFTFGLISRIFSLLALLMVGPLVTAMMPIDGGSGLSSWSKNFVEKTISAYTAVFSMNILFMIIPIFQTFGMFGPDYLGGFPDLVVQMIFIVAGLLAVSKIDDVVAKSLHSGYLYKDGGDLQKQVNDNLWNPVQKGLVSTANFAGNLGAAIVTKGASAPRGGSLSGRLGGWLGSKISNGARRSDGDRGNLTNRDKKDAMQASKTDEKIRQEALVSVNKEIEKEYDKGYQTKSQQAYNDYVSRGGTKTAQEFADSTAIGSYADANSQWESMTKSQQAAYATKNDYLKQYFTNNNTDKTIDFNTWEKNGASELAKDTVLVSGKGLTQGDVQRNIGKKEEYVSKRQKEIVEQMKNGTANAGDEIAKNAIKYMEEENQKKIDAALRLIKRQKANQAKNFKNLIN